MKKKNQHRYLYVYIAVIAVVLLGIILVFFLRPKEEKKASGFLASTGNPITLYDLSYSPLPGKVNRGERVTTTFKKTVRDEDQQTYIKVTYQKQDYYVLEADLVKTEKEVVKEKKRYVRTPVTLYENANDSKISAMIKKGEEVELLDFDRLTEGQVYQYKVKYQDKTGYVYGKYLVETKEVALKNYDEKGNYLIHKGRGDTQGGGAGGDLDYYPYQKASFSTNPMPKEVRSLYLNNGRDVIANVDAYIELAKKSNINAFVVDIKDNTAPGYASPIMKKYSPTNYNHANNSFEEYQKAIKKLKEAGFYVIGRITVFKDSYYAADHPENTIMDTNTKKPFNHDGSYWPTPFSRAVWEFNVELAKEAVEEMGFQEIQFDYTRFPDRTYRYEKSGQMDMRNTYKEEKAQALQGFLFYACDQIHELNAYVSVDVFGESAHNYVTGYGQYWAAMSNIVDVISGMPYPDHFSAFEYDFDKVVWTVPYQLLNYWGSEFVSKRQKEIPTPAIVRTWIEAYDTTRSPYVTYDASKISDQIKGLYDAGLTGGYMTWNSSSSLKKYEQLSSAFQKNYIK